MAAHLIAHPTDVGLPVASNLVRIGGDGLVALFNNAGLLDVVVDVGCYLSG